MLTTIASKRFIRIEIFISFLMFRYAFDTNDGQIDEKELTKMISAIVTF
jgi:hypothetical protein